MGRWGPENFQSDAASEFASSVITKLFADATNAINGRNFDDEIPMCAIELACVLLDLNAGGQAPSPNVVDEWQQKVLTRWDKGVAALYPDLESRNERRAVVVRTFERLKRLAIEDSTD